MRMTGGVSLIVGSLLAEEGSRGHLVQGLDHRGAQHIRVEAMIPELEQVWTGSCK
jgi:hypothetical protein